MKTLDDLQTAITNNVIRSVTLGVAVNGKCLASCTHGPQFTYASKWGDTLAEAIGNLVCDLNLTTAEPVPLLPDDDDEDLL